MPAQDADALTRKKIPVVIQSYTYRLVLHLQDQRDIILEIIRVIRGPEYDHEIEERHSMRQVFDIQQLDESLKGKILMSIGFGQRGFDVEQQLLHRQAGGDTRAQSQEPVH